MHKLGPRPTFLNGRRKSSEAGANARHRTFSSRSLAKALTRVGRRRPASTVYPLIQPLNMEQCNHPRCRARGFNFPDWTKLRRSVSGDSVLIAIARVLLSLERGTGILRPIAHRSLDGLCEFLRYPDRSVTHGRQTVDSVANPSRKRAPGSAND